MNERANERTNERMNERTNERANRALGRKFISHFSQSCAVAKSLKDDRTTKPGVQNGWPTQKLFKV